MACSFGARGIQNSAVSKVMLLPRSLWCPAAGYQPSYLFCYITMHIAASSPFSFSFHFLQLLPSCDLFFFCPSISEFHLVYKRLQLSKLKPKLIKLVHVLTEVTSWWDLIYSGSTSIRMRTEGKNKSKLGYTIQYPVANLYLHGKGSLVSNDIMLMSNRVLFWNFFLSTIEELHSQYSQLRP